MQRFLRIMVVMLLVGMLLLYPLLAPTPHRIDEAHFELITVGMTEADVEGIFGVPAGSYDWARPNQVHLYLITLLEAQELAVQFELNQRVVQHEPGFRIVVPPLDTVARENKNWVGRHGAFTITLDQHGRVVSKHHLGATEIEFPWRDHWRKLTGR